MLRRKFLSFTAEVVVVASDSFAELAGEAKRSDETIGLGFSLYGMKSLPIVAALKLCRKIGYDCVELPILADWPADSARLTADERRQIQDALTESRLRFST